MKKRVYISADYSEVDGDRDVIDVLNQWSNDEWRNVNFVDMAAVSSGSVSADPDCRPCDLKREFNRQINLSSAVIIIVGDKTATRTAGSNCNRYKDAQFSCSCTPYKQNTNGTKSCKIVSTSVPGPDDDVGNINGYSYLRHEFEQAKKRQKNIVVVYNAMKKEPDWLPTYMKGYEDVAFPFWCRDGWGNKVGNYQKVKEALGFD